VVAAGPLGIEILEPDAAVGWDLKEPCDVFVCQCHAAHHSKTAAAAVCVRSMGGQPGPRETPTFGDPPTTRRNR